MATWIPTQLLLSPLFPSTRETVVLSLPDLIGEQSTRFPTTAAVANARESTLVSLPDLNGEQLAVAATPAVPTSRDTALVSLPDLNGEQRALTAITVIPNAWETAGRALARAPERTEGFLFSNPEPEPCSG